MQCSVFGNVKRLICGTAFLCLLLSAWIANAQTPADQDVLSLSIEELARAKVFTASRHLEDSRDAPSAVSIITAEEIARHGWRTLADALRSLRGFYTAYDRTYDYLGVRGFQRPGDFNSRILLLINGHRLNENVYGTAFIGAEFPLDLDLIDHIEVVRGPSSSLFGTNAVFGVINVITRRPTPEAMVEASGDTSSFLGRTGRLTTAFQKGRWSALLSGSMYRSDGHSQLFYPEFAAPETNHGFVEDADGDRYAHAFADLQYGNFRVQGLFGTRTKIVPTASYETNFNDPGNRATDTRGYVDVSYHRSLSSRADLDARLYYDSYEFLQTVPFGGTDPATRYMGFGTSRADWIGTEVNLGQQIGRHRIIAGADYEYSPRVDQKDYLAGQPPFLNDHRTPWLAAGYGEAELNLVPKLSIRAGGRYDWFEAFGGAFSPRIALVYSLNSRTGLKYIYGRAFRAPNAYETYYVDGISIGTPGLHLKPENMASHELVLERSLTAWLRMTTEGFYNNLTNLIDLAPDPASGLTHFVNTGHNRGRGVEFQLDAKWGSGLSARASYALADAQDDRQHERLANSPLHQAKLNAAIPVTRRAFAGLELLYTSAQESYRGTRVPSSFVTNLTFSTKPLLGGWEFSASCYNAFDRRWFAPAGPELRQPEILQDGRTYRFKIYYRLPIRREPGK